MTALASLRDALAAVAGPELAVAVTTTASAAEPLFSQEEVAMARARPARRAEFAAGRAAARHAMAMLGLPAQPIPVGADRAPIWPAGLTGSISHSDGICVAVLGRAGGIAGLGVDLEPDAPLPADLWPEVLRPEEVAALQARPPEQRGQIAREIFIAKEAVYKCHYPLIGKVVGFDALTVHPAADTFVARFSACYGPVPLGHQVGGRMLRHSGHLVALVLRQNP